MVAHILNNKWIMKYCCMTIDVMIVTRFAPPTPQNLKNKKGLHWQTYKGHNDNDNIFYNEKVPLPPRCKFLDTPLNCYSNSCRITRIPGLQAHPRVPGTHQNSRHTPLFQAHTNIPGTHQDSRHIPGCQAHTRIPDTYQDSRHTPGFQAHTRFQAHIRFQAQTRIPGTNQDSGHIPRFQNIPGFQAHVV